MSDPGAAQRLVTELKVSGHLMTLDAGLFCVFHAPDTAPPDGVTGLPGVRLSPAPQGPSDAVTISTFRDDGWLDGRDAAALIRVSRGPAQVLVTVYQMPDSGQEAPRLQVLRLSDAVPPRPTPQAAMSQAAMSQAAMSQAAMSQGAPQGLPQGSPQGMPQGAPQGGPPPGGMFGAGAPQGRAPMPPGPMLQPRPPQQGMVQGGMPQGQQGQAQQGAMLQGMPSGMPQGVPQGQAPQPLAPHASGPYGVPAQQGARPPGPVAGGPQPGMPGAMPQGAMPQPAMPSAMPPGALPAGGVPMGPAPRGGDPTASGAPGGQAAPEVPPELAEVAAHVQGRGDVLCRLGEWMGDRGSGRWVEGFAIAPRGGLGREDIEYQAVLGRGWLSPWAEGGQFCGSRGMALPVLGLRVRVRGEKARHVACRVSATFVDGSSSGPTLGGEGCESPALAPLESFLVELVPAPQGMPQGGNQGGGREPGPSGWGEAAQEAERREGSRREMALEASRAAPRSAARSRAPAKAAPAAKKPAPRADKPPRTPANPPAGRGAGRAPAAEARPAPRGTPPRGRR